ncbi:unnamed protein product [Ilex paraguariensis]|uniref:Uncharacterized protein n=1 Tax=Ilex paraguariensis TaxID=185542 RepID=A0ABC8UTE7_9AQUA
MWPDSRSVGALAGLAVAIVFTWRLLRSASGPQRRQPKRQAVTPSRSSVSMNSNSNVVASAVCPPSEDSRAQNVIDEFFLPVKPTLGQIVRQRLSEVAVLWLHFVMSIGAKVLQSEGECKWHFLNVISSKSDIYLFRG